MAKVGSNAPCPCGSGKKFKRCCSGTQNTTPLAGGEALEASPLPDRRALERGLAAITRSAAEKEFSSPEEIDAHVQELLVDGKLPSQPPRSALEEAQDVMYDAWEDSGPRRVNLARKALRISPDCADAYVLLAEETTRSADDALRLGLIPYLPGSRG